MEDFSKQKEKIKIVTHDGDFHVDDIFAVSALLLLLGEENTEVIRTRDLETIKTGDYVVDVGGEYDESKNLFDHHQGGAGEHDNGVPYSSIGLVWKKYGEEICGSRAVTDSINAKIIQPIDAMDNGICIYHSVHKELYPYIFHDMKRSFAPAWNETERTYNGAFAEIVAVFKRVLEREIINRKALEDGEKFVVEAYEKAEDKRIIIFDKNYPWQEVLSKYKEPLYTIKPRPDGKWKVEAVADDFHCFDVRKPMPESWAGKRDEELVEAAGVEDAIFCHNGRWMVVAGSKEGAIKLAKLAVEN